MLHVPTLAPRENLWSIRAPSVTGWPLTSRPSRSKRWQRNWPRLELMNELNQTHANKGVPPFLLLFLRCLPRYQKWSAAMAERMSLDFGFKPRAFVLAAGDLAALWSGGSLFNQSAVAYQGWR